MLQLCMNIIKETVSIVVDGMTVESVIDMQKLLDKAKQEFERIRDSRNIDEFIAEERDAMSDDDDDW